LAETRKREVYIRARFTQLVCFRVTSDFAGTHVESYYSSSIGRIYGDVHHHYVALFLLNGKICFDYLWPIRRRSQKPVNT